MMLIFNPLSLYFQSHVYSFVHCAEILSIPLTEKLSIHFFTRSEKLLKVSYVMSFSITSLCNCGTTKFKKLSVGFMSGLHGRILNIILPNRAAARRAVLEFCLGHPSIKNLLSTGFILLSNAE